MKVKFFLFILFLVSLTPAFTLENKIILNFYDKMYDLININITDNEPRNIFECANYIKIFNINESDYLEFIKCFFNFSKNNTMQAKNFLENIIEILNLPDMKEYMKNEEKLSIVIKIFNDSMSNGLMDAFFGLLLNHDIVADSIIILIDEYKRGNDLGYFNYTIIRKAFANIFNVEESHDFLNLFFEKNETKKDLFDLFSALFSHFPNVSSVYELLRDKIKDIETQKKFLKFAIDAIKAYEN